MYCGDGKNIPCILNIRTLRKWAVSLWLDRFVPKEKGPFIYSLIIQSVSQSVVCLTTGPQPLPKTVLHRVQYSAYSFNFQYPLFSLGTSSSCLSIPPRHSVTSIPPYTFPSITCFRRQFLLNTWPILLAFLLCIVSWRQIQEENKKKTQNNRNQLNFMYKPIWQKAVK
jgi:hypothetical protein